MYSVLFYEYNKEMKVGGFSLPGLPAVPSIGSALDAAKGKAQQVATDVADKGQKAANSVGLGDKFRSMKDAAIAKLESLTGLDLSVPTGGCPPDRIDVPTVSDILVSSADTPYPPTTFMDTYFSYVVVDSRNPPEAETTNKSILWYISIANTFLLITVGTLYGTLS
jgi:hypothetical protein